MYKSEDLTKEIPFPGRWRNPESSNTADSASLLDKNLVIQVEAASLHTARLPPLPCTERGWGVTMLRMILERQAGANSRYRREEG